MGDVPRNVLLTAYMNEALVASNFFELYGYPETIE